MASVGLAEADRRATRQSEGDNSDEKAGNTTERHFRRIWISRAPGGREARYFGKSDGEKQCRLFATLLEEFPLRT